MPIYACEHCGEMERQLAEKTAEAKDLRAHYKWALEEIEAMWPVVEACKARYEHHNPWDSTIPCYCPTCQWYRDYLGRKQT